MNVEAKPKKTTLKRTEKDELLPIDFSSKKPKIDCSELSKTEIYRILKQRVKVKYPKAFPNFNKNPKNVDLSMACHFAAQKIDSMLIKLLLLYGAPANYVDDQNENALTVACRSYKKACEVGGHVQIEAENCIEYLLNAKCDPFQQNTNGIAPINLIAAGKSVKIFTQLRDLGYNLNTPINSLDDSPLMHLCNSPLGKNQKKNDLQEKDLRNKDQQQKKQRIKDREETSKVVQALVDLGCDPLQKNKFNQTPLEVLVKYKLLNVNGYISLLNKIPEEGQFLASQILLLTNNCVVFDRLKGISVDDFDSSGKTALYRAVEKLDTNLIIYLLVKGANCRLRRRVKQVKPWEKGNPIELIKLKMKEYCQAVESFDSQITDIEDPTKRKTQRKTKLIDYLDHKLDDLKLLRHKCNCILQGFNYILNLRTNKKEDVNLSASLTNIINKKYVENPNTFFIQDKNGEYVECEYTNEQ